MFKKLVGAVGSIIAIALILGIVVLALSFFFGVVVIGIKVVIFLILFAVVTDIVRKVLNWFKYR